MKLFYWVGRKLLLPIKDQIKAGKQIKSKCNLLFYHHIAPATSPSMTRCWSDCWEFIHYFLTYFLFFFLFLCSPRIYFNILKDFLFNYSQVQTVGFTWNAAPALVYFTSFQFCQTPSFFFLRFHIQTLLFFK